MKTEKQKQMEKDRSAAKIILKELAESTAPVNVNWAMEERYIQALMTGIKAAREANENDKGRES